MASAPVKSPSPPGDTAAKILDAAEVLVQRRGFNGFSYGDVAGELGITRASLHYHYPGKATLGRNLIERYASRFRGSLSSIDAANGSAPERLRAYAELYAKVLGEGRMCLCGMLAAEYLTLPQGLTVPLVEFFDDNEAWLSGVLEQGRADGEVHFSGSAVEAARMLIGGLEGAMLIARPYDDAKRFQSAAAGLLAGLGID